jgi:hypothetical protein
VDAARVGQLQDPEDGCVARQPARNRKQPTDSAHKHAFGARLDGDELARHVGSGCGLRRKPDGRAAPYGTALPASEASRQQPRVYELSVASSSQRGSEKLKKAALYARNPIYCSYCVTAWTIWGCERRG